MTLFTWRPIKKQLQRSGVPPASYAEKTKIKQSSISVQTDAFVDSDLDKDIESRVNVLVSKALENLLANLVRICGNAMPAEILENPIILLEPAQPVAIASSGSGTATTGTVKRKLSSTEL